MANDPYAKEKKKVEIVKNLIKITYALSRNINLVQEINLSSKLLTSQMKYLRSPNFWKVLEKNDKFSILISIKNFIQGSKANCVTFAEYGGL